MARPSVVLPEPDSPTTPTVSPSRTVDRHAVDRLHVTDGACAGSRADRKPDLDVVVADHHRRAGVGERRLALRFGGEQRPAYRDGAGAAKTRATGPASTIRPCCITATSSAILRTMPRSWVMNSIAMPSLAWSSFEQFEDLRLHRDVERGRRLVGDEEVGTIGERHRDHHPLALAAGKLMRIGAEARGGIGECRPRSAAPRPGLSSSLCGRAAR